jgi:hypothetical protein
MHVESYRLRSSFFRNGRNTIMKHCAYSSFFCTVDRLNVFHHARSFVDPMNDQLNTGTQSCLPFPAYTTASLNERVLCEFKERCIFCLLRTGKFHFHVELIHCGFSDLSVCKDSSLLGWFVLAPPMFRNFMIMFSRTKRCEHTWQRHVEYHEIPSLDVRLCINCQIYWLLSKTPTSYGNRGCKAFNQTQHKIEGKLGQ